MREDIRQQQSELEYRIKDLLQTVKNEYEGKMAWKRTAEYKDQEYAVLKAKYVQALITVGKLNAGYKSGDDLWSYLDDAIITESEGINHGV